MTEDPLVKWAKSELKRLEDEENWEKVKKEIEERERIKRERYLKAPIMRLDGKIIKKNQPRIPVGTRAVWLNRFYVFSPETVCSFYFQIISSLSRYT